MIQKWVIKDADDNILNTFQGLVDISLLNNDWYGTMIVACEQLPDEEEPVAPEATEEDKRRLERTLVFSNTLDIMNALWFNGLTQVQQDEIAVWRQAWLDYPSDLTLTRPEDLDLF